ncbi:metallophosphoesterase [Candidatus Woesearchaeota archaeon]|nr:metallophosphoesterase [Candidatus Woesearchaeota archaeon]
MKILAFTDHHASRTAEARIFALAKKQKPDLLICTGDISFFGTDVKKVIVRLNALAKRVGIPLLLVPGNHEDGKPLQKYIQTMHLSSIIYLHKKSYRFRNYFFMAWGSGGFAYRDPVFLKWASAAIKQARLTDKKILLFHGPPYGTLLDVVVSGHCGNKDYTLFIKKNSPDLVICGHIHECFGKVQKIGKAIAVNPGPFGAMITI